ncbi:MAG: PucR family transcriptional regulator ligand-binding domain-containing protein, partial [Actinobacteria bacterium]|nr:PucR family transcriptional regulator ligand-binding domain-containing protein [Actinomycetota bacterium]
LEGGEIVLTTGLALGAEDPRWLDFVAGLNRARVAAIGFGIGVNHERIPAPLIAAASTYRVALVEVPPPVPFIAVSKAVAGLLRADELRAAQRALQAHQRLLEGAQGSQSSAEVLASIAQATGRQLALLAADGTPIASTAGFAASTRSGDEDSARRGPNRGAGSGESIDVDVASGIRLVLADGEPLGPEGRAVVAAGAMVLGLGLRGERGEDERERGRWARLTEGMLRGALGADAMRLLDPESQVADRVRAIAVQGAAEDLAAWRRAPRVGWERLVTAGEPGSPGIALAWQLCDGADDAVTRAIAAASSHGLDTVVGRLVRPDDAVQSCRSALARIGDLSSVAQLYEAPRTPVTVWADHSPPLLETLISEH